MKENGGTFEGSKITSLLEFQNFFKKIGTENYLLYANSNSFLNNSTCTKITFLLVLYC